MRIRLIASDLDGTLLTNEKQILESTKEAIAEAVKQGIYFVPATGRPFEALPEVVLELPGLEYVITSNGAAVYSVKEKRRIFEKFMTAESIEKLLEIPLDMDMAYEVMINGVPYADAAYVENPAAYGLNEQGSLYIRKTRNPIADMRKFTLEHRERIDNIAIVCSDQKRKAEMSKKFRAAVSGIFVTSSVPHLIEIGNTDAGKGKTICHLLKMLGSSPEEAMCFGDADNDVDMLRAVRYGIAMKNGTDTCKRAAFAVTASNQEDGVGQMIRKVLAGESI